MTAYTLYELLRHLTENVAWRNQEDKRAALNSIAEYERLNIFGNVMESLRCSHDTSTDGLCDTCGRRTKEPTPPQPRYQTPFYR